MGDIDFDELDQAVNTLMNGVQKTPPQGQNNPSVAAPVSVSNPVPAVQASAPQQATEPLIPAVPVAPHPQIQINKGRFMDVKPPSANPVLPPAPTPVNDSSSVVTSSTAGGGAIPAIGPVKPTQPAMEISTTQTPAQMPGASTDQAAFSPFLPNAQVEKRPLGGNAMPSGAVPSPFDEQEKKPTPPAGSTQSEPMQSPEPILQNTTQPVEDSPSATPNTIDINNDQKAEVNQGLDDQRSLDAANYSYKQAPQQESELAKLESSEVVATPAPVPATGKPQDESVRSVESGDTERLKGGHPWDAAKNQEEKAAEKAAEKAHGIYDEHKALSHPAKQKSGWWVVIAIIIVIIVVASLGVAAFFYFGPGL